MDAKVDADARVTILAPLILRIGELKSSPRCANSIYKLCSGVLDVPLASALYAQNTGKRCAISISKLCEKQGTGCAISISTLCIKHRHKLWHQQAV